MLSTGSLLPACVVTGPPPAPLPELPPQFLDSGRTPQSDDWWRTLGDASLTQAIQTALAANPSVAQVAARLSAAKAAMGQEQASLIPTLTVTANQQASENNETTTFGLSAVYEVDLWGRLRSRRAAAAYSLEAAAFALETARIALISDVATQWHQVATTRATLASIATQQSQYETVLALVEQRLRNGQASAADVLRQRQLVESTRSLAASTRADLAQQRHALDQLLGQPAGTGHAHPTLASAPPVLPAVGIPAETVMRRPDVRGAWAQVAAADRSLAAAIANRFPQFEIGLNISAEPSGSHNLFENWLSSLAATLVGPLVDGGERRAQVAARQAELDEALAAFRETVLSAFGEIQDVLAELAERERQLDSLTRQRALSQAVIDRQTRQLRQGTTDFPSLLDTQISHGLLEREWLATRQQWIAQHIHLHRAVAGPITLEQERPTQ